MEETERMGYTSAFLLPSAPTSMGMNATPRFRVILRRRFLRTMQPYSSQPQPAWIEGQTVEGRLRERAMFRSVLGWMFVGLLLTAVSSLWVFTSPAMQQLVLGNPFAVWILFLAEILLVVNLSWRLTKLSPAAAAASFLIFSLLNGLSLSGIAFVYTRASIAQAFIVGPRMFCPLALFAPLTHPSLPPRASPFSLDLT